MLRQSSLGGSVHWTLPFAAELRVEAHPLSSACSASSEHFNKFAYIFPSSGNPLGFPYTEIIYPSRCEEMAL